MPSGLRVAAIVVDYDGGDMTTACLDALASAGGCRIVLVDNGSHTPLTDAQLAPFGDAVDVVRSPRNRGFGGGVNLGLAHLGVARPGSPARPGAPGAVALVNNDAFVQPDWLDPLLAALDADPAVGAASAKLLFEPEFVELDVACTPLPQRRGVPRVGPLPSWPGAVFGDGFVAVHPGEWWATQPHATLFVPGGHPDSIAVGAATSGERPLVSLTEVRRGVSVVQNAGNELTPELWVRDRGARQRDDGRWDTPGDVWGWCGGAVLLRSAYLADAGWFDERLFLYWEDVDLSWRGARRGWRYRYVPASVVRHRHGASMGDRSATFEYLNQRNRLVVLARHAGVRAAARAWARHVAEIGWFLVRGDRARFEMRLRAVGGALAQLARRRPDVARPAVRGSKR